MYVFFQAEDGIRDDLVTGVQTCALPIFGVRRFQDFVALRAQPHAQQLTDRRLVVDHQNLERCRAHAAVSNRSTAGGIGSLIANTAPLRSLRFAALIVPCMASMNPRQTPTPSPVLPPPS